MAVTSEPPAPHPPTPVGVVSQVWRYPVKSMMGERLERIELTRAGVLGDRGWATRDEVRGGIRGAKKIGGLMALSARWAHEPRPDDPTPAAVITLPDGSTVTTTDPDADARVSAALDHRVSLWPLQPAEDLDHYRRGAPDTDDILAELRAIFGREDDEPLPDLSVFPPEIIEFESPPGSYVDAFPLLVMTTTSLATLADLCPGSDTDVRRFRPNVLIDTGTTADRFPELGWVGRQLTLGAAVVEVVAPCPRCVMITRAFADLPADRAMLRAVVAEADQNLGVYARVLTPGPVSAGDHATVS